MVPKLRSGSAIMHQVLVSGNAILYYYFTNTDDNHAKCPTIMQQYYCNIHTYIILIVLTGNVNVHNSIERLKGLRIQRPKFGYIPVRWLIYHQNADRMIAHSNALWSCIAARQEREYISWASACGKGSTCTHCSCYVIILLTKERRRAYQWVVNRRRRKNECHWSWQPCS